MTPLDHWRHCLQLFCVTIWTDERLFTSCFTGFVNCFSPIRNLRCLCISKLILYFFKLSVTIRAYERLLASVNNTMHIQTAFFYFAPVWLLRCVCISILYLNFLSQSEHTNGSSPCSVHYTMHNGTVFFYEIVVVFWNNNPGYVVASTEYSICGKTRGSAMYFNVFLTKPVGFNENLGVERHQRGS